jgi:hypothetical protein
MGVHWVLHAHVVRVYSQQGGLIHHSAALLTLMQGFYLSCKASSWSFCSVPSIADLQIESGFECIFVLSGILYVQGTSNVSECSFVVKV